MSDHPDDLARDLAAISRISAVPALLKYICQITGLGFAAVARVTGDSSVVCAVEDRIGLNLEVGSVEPRTTLCGEARSLGQPIVVDHASWENAFGDHRVPLRYRIESYISMPIVRSDGEHFGNLYAMDHRPTVVSGPQTLAMFKVFADLIAMQLDSEERQHASDLALLDAKETADLREQFIAVLGHDLRNPLAAVGATAELLLRRDEPEIAKLGSRLKSTTKRMSALIDDVLDFARGRLGAGIVVDMAQRNDMAVALHDVISELRQANPAREILEDLAIGDSIRCDGGRLQQLLSNLVGNALTYGSPTEPIRVSAMTSAGWFVLTVSNGGTPISPEDLPLVFKPYWRPHTSKPGGGLGLGLYICSQIAKAHGGEMVVSSSVASGTLFGTRLPLALQD